MNGLLSQLSSFTATILGRTTRFVSNNATPSNFSFPIKSLHSCVRSEFALTGTRCYSTRKPRKSGVSQRTKVEAETTMDKEKDAFYVVRKGDVVGIYNSLSDSQAQVGSSVCDPPVSVFKGYSLSNETEEYLLSHGLKNALYTIRASDLKEDLFGSLVPCPFQEPSSTKGTISNADTSKKRAIGVLEQDNVDPSSTKGTTSSADTSKRRAIEVLGQDYVKSIGLTSISEDPFKKQVKLDRSTVSEASSLANKTCIVEFDGASKGNPGKAGAGAILRSKDGNVIHRVREGVGIATNNFAEYRAAILGMKYALKKGFTNICIQGDSKLVCLQIDGSWKVKNESLATLYKVAKELKDKFASFQISHVLREFNSEADAQANLAVHLADGQVQEE
ncbi:uncharacterized protein LOC131620502 isoform X1 [Vicia villosa]|uniref:uncharacterized protein LOC131620502 isoform X1 n=2 Tax=Vicia villosa TaxID=3911 RepID=UPI00273C8231|nr:uncharacterized protein LOC131620502 isoform X1 [Vicia villosa]